LLGGGTAKHCGDQLLGVFHYSSLGDALLCWAGYTTDSATHFYFLLNWPSFP